MSKTKPRLKQLFDREMSRKDFLSIGALATIALLGVGGVIEELLSHASTPYSSTSASKGVLTGNAKSLAITGAASGNAVEFEPNSTPNLKPNAPSSIAGVTIPTTLVFDDEFDTGKLDTTKWVPGYYHDNNNGGGAFGSTNTLVQSNVAFGSGGLEVTLSGSPSAGYVGCVSTSPWSNEGPWTPNETLGITNPITNFTGFSISPAGGGVGGLNPGASGPVYVEYGATAPEGGGGIANWFQLWTASDVGGGMANPVLEIDILESGGVANSTVHYVTYNDPTDPGNYQRNSVPAGTSPATGGVFHTWGVLWTTTFVAFVLDGVVQPESGGTPFYFSSAGVGALSQPPQGLIIANSYGGLAPVFPATATVRYARVFQG